jgi:hypothetical protein
MTRSGRHGPRAEDRASGLFTALDIALERGDYAAAARAQQELADLGWEVRHRPRELTREQREVTR